jgi:hypothetical protein
VGALAIVAALVAPVVANHDSFPLSTYPMYSRARSRVVSVPTAVARLQDGTLQRLSLPTIGASDDPLIVAGELRAAIAAGRADQRCAAIAARHGADGGGGVPDTNGSVTIEVVIERHDAVARVRDEPSLLDRVVHAACPVST